MQDERQKSGVNGCENSEQLADDMPVDKILEAEMQADSKFQLADFNVGYFIKFFILYLH